MPTTSRFPTWPIHARALAATSLVLSACVVDRPQPLAPEAVAFRGRGASLTSSIVLGSGMSGGPGQRDAANQLIACSGKACPSGGLPQAAYITYPHNAYATPLSGTSYIAQVANGTTISSPGFACCTTADFENKFTLPVGASSASITIRVLADNQAIVKVNGVEVGRQLPGVYANFAGPVSTFTAGFTPDPSGTNSLQVTLVDEGGVLGLDYHATVTYVTDDSPPSIVPTITGTVGNDGWYTSDVDVSWSVADAESDVTNTQGCGATSVTQDTDGATFTCSATSAGGPASESVTIKRDATAPVIAFSGNSGTYTVDQQVNITCAASDAMSDLASSSCPGASGAAYTFGVGTQSLSASADDNAGNTNAASTQFTVQVTSGSLCALVNAWVSQKGVANSMCQQLKNGAYGAFRNHVSAQAGKSVSAAHAAILIALSQNL